MIYNIIYVSKAHSPMSEKQLTSLLEESRSWNEEYGITGMLLYIEGQEPGQTPGRFMQVIEGAEKDIQLLFSRIKADPRHHQITPLHQDYINKRNFTNWLMGFKTVSNDTLIKDGYIDLNDYFLKTNRQPKFSLALNYLKSFNDMNLK